MQSDDPAFLPVGTEVSAKFKGAFCEAKIKKISKSVKCKVSLKEAPFGSIVVEDGFIKSGSLELNHPVEVQQGKQLLKGVIQHLKDCSTYHVVFNDGDEKVLRRTQVCLKGAKHFDSAVNLDALPLYNPESFGSPVVRGAQKKAKKRKLEEASPSKRGKRKKDDEEDSEDEKNKKREKRAAASAASVAIGEMDQGDTEVSCDGSSSGDASDVEKEREKDRKKKTEKDEEKTKDVKEKKTPVKQAPSTAEERKEKFAIGSVQCVYEESVGKGKWYPAVVVAVKAYTKRTVRPKTPTKKETTLRSFQNGKYVLVAQSLLQPFSQQNFAKKLTDGFSTALRLAVEKAQGYVDKESLPGSWDREDIYGEDQPTTSKQKKDKDEKVTKDKDKDKDKESSAAAKKKEKEEKKDKKEEIQKEKEKDKKAQPKAKPAAETESSESDSSDEEEYGEERDLFVAQLYKFQEERGTPINRAPVLGGKDIDLYRFYRVVQHYGGAKKATANAKWKRILSRLKLEGCAGATPVTVRKAYIRYLAHFNSFYKRLGWSLDGLASTSTANSPRERRLIRAQTEDTKTAAAKIKRRKSTTAEGKEKVKKEKEEDEKDTDKESVADVREKEKDVKPEVKKEKDDKKIERVTPAPTSSATPEKEKDSKEKEKSKKKEEVEKERERHEKMEKIEKEKLEKERLEKEMDKEKTDDAQSEELDDSDFKEEEEDDYFKDSEDNRDKRSEKDIDDDDVIDERKKEKEIDNSDDDVIDGNDDVIDGNDDVIDGIPKKKREKKKLSMRPPKGIDSGESYKDPDEGYNQADLVSHFYLGQKVRAQHHGRWYDARVVTVRQPPVKEIADMLAMNEGDEAEPPKDAVLKIHTAMADVKCFVHYLGWNSRYDEWITLNKIRISIKDELSSLSMLRRESAGRLPDSRLEWFRLWTAGSAGISSLHRKSIETSPNMFTMGGYRPRRVSISQYEQINAAAEGLKREREHKGSPSKQHLTSPPPSSSRHPSFSSKKEGNKKIEEEIEIKREDEDNKEAPNEAKTGGKDKLSHPAPSPSPSVRSMRISESSNVTSSPTRESKRIRTASLSREHQPSPLPAVSEEPPTVTQSTRAASPIKRGRTPARLTPQAAAPTPPPAPSPAVITTVVIEQKPVPPSVAPAPLPATVTSSPDVPAVVVDVVAYKEEPTLVVKEAEIQLEATPIQKKPMTSESQKRKRAKSIEQKEIREKTPVEAEKDENVKETLVDAAVPTPAEPPVEEKISPIEPKNKRRRKESEAPEEKEEKEKESETADEPQSGSTTKKEEEEDAAFDRLEEETLALCQLAQNDDEVTSEGHGSGSETPQRTDGEDFPDSTLSSPAPRGGSIRGMKRKRLLQSRHSNMVVDRKYIKKTPKEKMTSSEEKKEEKDNEEDDDDEEEEGTIARATYIKQKNAMHRLMEANGTLNDLSPLGMQCISELHSLSEDDMIDACERRLMELRDIYAESRSHITRCERRWRTRNEKKKEKLPRDQSTTPQAAEKA